MPMVMIDALPTGSVYVDSDEVVGIVPVHDDIGSWVLLGGGHRVRFPGDIDQAYSQIFHRE